MADDARTDVKNAESLEIIALWPNGPPRTIPDVGVETPYKGPPGVSVGTTMLRNISQPTMTVYRPDPAKANGAGVVVCPGGGWRILAWEHEGLDVAKWFAARGFTAFLLKYRVQGTPADAEVFNAEMAAMDARVAAPLLAAQCPRALSDIVAADDPTHHAREVAADDGRRALAIARERAAEWGVEPGRIGMIGFSAGAFLTADVAMDPGGPPLAFAAPIYGGETRGRPVPPDAPPLFTCIAHDDRLLLRMVEGLYADWSNADRSAELHIFARGAHGFGMIRQGLPSDRWIDLLAAWLTNNGFG